MKFIINFLFVYFISTLIGFILLESKISFGFFMAPEPTALFWMVASFVMGGIVPSGLEITIPAIFGKVVVCSIITGGILAIQGVDK